jgi:hypothetical protein
VTKDRRHSDLKRNNVIDPHAGTPDSEEDSMTLTKDPILTMWGAVKVLADVQARVPMQLK